MAVTTPRHQSSGYDGVAFANGRPTGRQDPGHQAFWLMRMAFTVAPIAALLYDTPRRAR